MGPKSSECNIGGLSEDRNCVRRGELGWVPGLQRNGNFRLWYFQFRNGAMTYLNERVYPNAEERRYGFLNALTRAAQMGNNEELLLELELLDSDNVQCEELLERVKQIYQPQDALLEQKASEEFFSFRREGKLGETVRKLNSLVLECKKAGYKPDEKALRLKYKSLLRKDEVALFEVYLSKDEAAESEKSDQHIRRVLEAYARDREGISSKQEAAGFCGGSFGNSSDAKNKGKSQKQPRRAGYSGGGNRESKAPDTSECKKCGRSNCKALKSKTASDCHAHKLKCSGCGQTGHFLKCCFKKAQKQKAKANFAEADDQEDADYDDVPPGFLGGQPKA